jgi:hypothetical protein
MTRCGPFVRGKADWLRTLVGARLSGVTYWYLPHVDGSAYEGGRSGLDGDLEAVVLEFSNRGGVTIRWFLEGLFAGLALSGESEERCRCSCESVAAGGRDAWHAHMGMTIVSVGAAWFVSMENAPESLWAMRLQFGSGSVVVALGTEYPELCYAADELVVIHDPALACAYRPSQLAGNAWGRTVT